ncbi:nuclear pore complex assembly-domain-containing protein [Lentinula aff. lateritia]|uniref:Nuclear pore complex assembly-domain-containing protein n=1 Tax=Lentinula aff. lateritia TaxID=2804960 RepID=A0ACC1TQ26_9AGAR|nr:nuclear pore complex assembly-domain-containing protein [Lentinula aff. lateritia]
MDIRLTNLLSYFDITADLFPWHKERVQAIEQRRAILDDTLLFDILLTLGGIREPDTLFPPNDVPGLQRLLNAIAESTYDALKKDCLFYYLLKWHRDGRERRFQRDRLIPPQFAQLAEAYWCLDAAVNVPIAVSLLSDSRLNQDYSSKILQAISTASDIDPHALVVRYIRTAKPLLTEPDDLDLYLVALAHHGLFEAWNFQRSFSELSPTRSRLFKKMLEWCVSPNLKTTALIHLLTIPLTPFEESILHSYASFPSVAANSTKSPSSLGLAALQNLACTRLIQIGLYADAIKLHRQFSVAGSIFSLTPAATKMIQQRKDAIENLYSTLPVVERTLLDAEIEGTPMFSMPTTNVIADDTNMSDSWEEIPARDLSSSSVRMNGVVSTASQNHPQINGVVLPTPSATAALIPRESLVPLIPSTAVSSSFSLTSSTGPGNHENLASSRLVATRFGGAPILPIASSSGDSSIALNSSLGFGGSLNSGGSAAHNLNGELTGLTQPSGRKSLPFNSAAFNSPNGALGLSTSGTGFGSTPTLFSSSKRKPNAFYKPPIVNNPPLSNPFSIDDPAPELGGASRRSTTGSHSPERPPSSNEKRIRNRGTDQLAVSEDGTHNGDILKNEAMAVDDGQGAGLDYPLFVNAGSNSPENDERESRRSLIGASSSTNSAGVSLRTSQKRPPGAFTDEEDEDEDMIDEIPSHPPPRQTRSRKSNVPYTSTSATTANTHTSASAKSSASASTSARTTKPRGKKPRHTTTSSKSKRRVPGGMSDDDDDDEEDDGDADQEEIGEDQDQVAPLAARRTMRKTRSSVASALSTEESGPRRRSSRISLAEETGAGGASSKRVTRKSTAGTGGKRKQR